MNKFLSYLSNIFKYKKFKKNITRNSGINHHKDSEKYRCNILVELYVTYFFLGKIKYAPGTIASLMSFPLWYFLIQILASNRFLITFSNFTLVESELFTILLALFTIIFFMFVLGVIYSSKYSSIINNNDPKEVVIDEVVGQLLTLVLTFFSGFFISSSGIADKIDKNIIFLCDRFILPLILFRIFDILKPWPINYLDKNIKGGLGIMIDDIAAAIFASIMHYAIIFLLIDIYA